MLQSQSMKKLTINTDGGSRGNPGDAAIGYVVYEDGKLVKKHGEYIGIKTNNEAEYQAVINVLEWVEKNYTKDNPPLLEFKLDSNLVVNQIKGLFKIKQNHLQLLAAKVHNALKRQSLNATFSHVYREFNREADFLVNQALDLQKVKNKQ